jgi:LAO/AO transport system kinase
MKQKEDDMSFRKLATKRTSTHRRQTDAKILDRVRKEFPGDRIACASAFALAEKMEISKAEMGRVLDELEIKIERCQLGCF